MINDPLTLHAIARVKVNGVDYDSDDVNINGYDYDACAEGEILSNGECIDNTPPCSVCPATSETDVIYVDCEHEQIFNDDSSFYEYYESVGYQISSWFKCTYRSDYDSSLYYASYYKNQNIIQGSANIYNHSVNIKYFMI